MKRIIIIIILIFIVIITSFFIGLLFDFLVETKDLKIKVKGDFTPVVYKGIIKKELVYFIFNKNNGNVPLILRNKIGVSVPNGGSIKNIFGFKLWVKDSSWGVPITSPKMEKRSKIIWEEEKVFFEYHNNYFEIIFN